MEKQRVITAAIALPLFLLFIWLGGWPLAALLTLLALMGGWEYWRMLRQVSLRQPLMWHLCGGLYLALGFLAFYGVRSLNGAAWLLIVIWSTDTAAYECGRRWGRRKLAPTISPNKTVEGALAGLVCALLLGGGYAWLGMDINILAAAAISLVVSAVGQLGDLAESRIKRLAMVKDSGKLLPGHGGVLDRFDSILLASPLMYIFLLLL